MAGNGLQWLETIQNIDDGAGESNEMALSQFDCVLVRYNLLGEVNIFCYMKWYIF